MAKDLSLDNVEARGPEEIKSPMSDNKNLVTELAGVEIVTLPELNLFGVEELTDVVKFAIDLANGLIYAYADGKLTIADLSHLLSPMMSLPAALTGVGNVGAEIKDLTEEEVGELLEMIKEDLQVTDEKAKAIIAVSIKLIMAIYELVNTVKA